MMCHDGMIEYLFLDEDIQQLTSAGADGYIRFWNLDVLKSLALIILINTSSSSPPSSSLGAKKQREKKWIVPIKKSRMADPMIVLIVNLGVSSTFVFPQFRPFSEHRE